MRPVSVLLVDDDDAYRTVLAGELRRRGYQMSTAATAKEGLETALAEHPRVTLLDLRLPDGEGLEVLKKLREKQSPTEVIMLTGHGTIDTAIEAIRLGAFDYVSKPCPIEELEIRLGKALERRSLIDRNRILESALLPADGEDLIGESPTFLEMLKRIEKVAATGSSVLVLGETGVGKEMVARRIHALSPRAARPFVAVECAALQEEILQSELFGHERGSFTGAVRSKPGLFEVADGGTLFLDEIGEVTPATQVKLLRVLEASTFRHVGGTDELKVDVRLLAATNRPLEKMVAEGLFREDLLYRLDAFRIEIPPLRQRREDIPALCQHFLARLAPRVGATRGLSAAALEALARHDWPGNVRELLHVLEHGLIVSDGPEIEVKDLPRSALRAAPAPAAGGESELMTLHELERAHIDRALRVHGGHRGKVARALGISERNLYRKLREHGLA